MKKKRFFGYFELIFDLFYLLLAFFLGIKILLGAEWVWQFLAGSAALVLGIGDAFHLVPRMLSIAHGSEEGLSKALGAGKLVTSITMTLFYLMLWHIGLLLFALPNAVMGTTVVYALAVLCIVLCILPQNRWLERDSVLKWAVWRNVPFLFLGLATAMLFGIYKGSVPGIEWMWLAIVLSFLFYIPVVLGAHRYPVLGMLMLPKTGMYLWMLLMFLVL